MLEVSRDPHRVPFPPRRHTYESTTCPRVGYIPTRQTESKLGDLVSNLAAVNPQTGRCLDTGCRFLEETVWRNEDSCGALVAKTASGQKSVAVTLGLTPAPCHLAGVRLKARFISTCLTRRHWTPQTDSAPLSTRSKQPAIGVSPTLQLWLRCSTAALSFWSISFLVRCAWLSTLARVVSVDHFAFQCWGRGHMRNSQGG